MKVNPESSIFLDCDYFELLLFNYDQFDLNNLDYFTLRDIVHILLINIGYIPLVETEDTNWMYAYSLIENYLKYQSISNQHQKLCFSYYEKKLDKTLHCRIIEKIFNLQDGNISLFRTKDLTEDSLYFGIDFRYDKFEQTNKIGHTIYLCSPDLAYRFYWVLHRNQNIKTLQEAENLYTIIYAEKNMIN